MNGSCNAKWGKNKCEIIPRIAAIATYSIVSIISGY